MRSTIYLSGPVEQSNDPESWRENIKHEYGCYKYYDPTEFIDYTVDEINENTDLQYYVVMECMRKVLLADSVLINWSRSELTWGTQQEQLFAWLNGTPIILYTGGESIHIHSFMRVFSDEIVESTEEAIRKIEEYTR